MPRQAEQNAAEETETETVHREAPHRGLANETISRRSRGDLAAISPGDLPAISLGYVERLRLYHRDDAPSGGRRVAIDGNLSN